MSVLAETLHSTLKDYNIENGSQWTFGSNWTTENKKTVETYINNYLFPKINETFNANVSLGDPFQWLTEEMDFIGQYDEEYSFLDTIPEDLSLDKGAENLLRNNFMEIATKLYGAGRLRKVSFSLADYQSRFGFKTFGDVTAFALRQRQKKLEDITFNEIREKIATLVDYSNNHVHDTRQVSSFEGFMSELNKAVLDLQEPYYTHNEVSEASNGALARLTTQTTLDKIVIFTSNDVAEKILSSYIANSFNIKGIDLTKQIISFQTLGGAWKLKQDVKVTASILKELNSVGIEDVEIGALLGKGEVFTYELPSLKDNLEEIVPDSENFALVADVRGIRFKQYTKNMIQEPFKNPATGTVKYYMHYSSSKRISPFYNKVCIKLK